MVYHCSGPHGPCLPMPRCSDAREMRHCTAAQESKWILKINMSGKTAPRTLTRKESRSAILLRLGSKLRQHNARSRGALRSAALAGGSAGASGAGWVSPDAMTSPAPTLYIFAISHYCEKARWALDHFGLAYRLKHVVPGLNRLLAKRLGAASGSLPFLAAADGPIAGSGAIIDWGERRRAADRASLAGPVPAEVLAIERRLDQVAGIHIRRYYYSAALLSEPELVRPIFSRDLALVPRLAVMLGWSKIVPKMIAGMDLGPAQGAQSRDRLVGELDWLDGLLGDGRAYLCGERFTRADLTAASLLAPLINPPQHPTYAGLVIPPMLEQDIAQWRQRPALQWVRRVYADNR